jgi:hypothetical protein
MEIVERILGKIVGYELSKEEMQMVSGGVVECERTIWYSAESQDPNYTCDENQEHA